MFGRQTVTTCHSSCIYNLSQKQALPKNTFENGASDKPLNSATVKKGCKPAPIRVSLDLPGYPSQAGSKPGDACQRAAPISLWPLGAAGVQIPLPAPFYQLWLFLSLFRLKSTCLKLFQISDLLHIESWKKQTTSLTLNGERNRTSNQKPIPRFWANSQSLESEGYLRFLKSLR